MGIPVNRWHCPDDTATVIPVRIRSNPYTNILPQIGWYGKDDYLPKNSLSAQAPAPTSRSPRHRDQAHREPLRWSLSHICFTSVTTPALYRKIRTSYPTHGAKGSRLARWCNSRDMLDIASHGMARMCVTAGGYAERWPYRRFTARAFVNLGHTCLSRASTARAGASRHR